MRHWTPAAMIRRHIHRLRRPLAAIQIAALLVWALGSVVWAAAPMAERCPMLDLSTAMNAADVPTQAHGCCAALQVSGEDAPLPAEDVPCRPGKGSCCCPMVAPVLPDAGLWKAPEVHADYAPVFGDPLMLDCLAPRELIVPPSV